MSSLQTLILLGLTVSLIQRRRSQDFSLMGPAKGAIIKAPTGVRKGSECPLPTGGEVWDEIRNFFEFLYQNGKFSSNLGSN